VSTDCEIAAKRNILVSDSRVTSISETISNAFADVDLVDGQASALANIEKLHLDHYLRHILAEAI